MLKFTCFLMLVAVAAADNRLEANRYVDALLQGFPDLARHLNLDPMPLPSEKVSFSKKIVLVTVKGSASYSGKLTGLSTLARRGDFYLGVEGSRGYIQGDQMYLSYIRGSYSGRAKFMSIGVGITISAKCNRVRIFIKVSSDMAPGSAANLDGFRISSVSSISVNVSGLGPLDWILGKLLSAVTNSFRGHIIRAVEGPVRGILASEVKKVSFPRI